MERFDLTSFTVNRFSGSPSYKVFRSQFIRVKYRSDRCLATSFLVAFLSISLAYVTTKKVSNGCDVDRSQVWIKSFTVLNVRLAITDGFGFRTSPDIVTTRFVSSSFTRSPVDGLAPVTRRLFEPLSSVVSRKRVSVTGSTHIFTCRRSIVILVFRVTPEKDRTVTPEKDRTVMPVFFGTARISPRNRALVAGVRAPTVGT